MMLQIFLPCYFGLVCDAFDGLKLSLYKSEWVSKDEKFKQLMKLVTENAKRTVKISAFGVFDVDLRTFMRIGNTFTRF